jgi:ribosomal 50S subunit-associated protein YjgA (DUF615 family)
MDNDAEMLKQMGNQITNLQVKYRGLPLDEQMSVHPALVQLLEEYARYQAKLLMIGIITNEKDLKEIRELKKSADDAADKMDLLVAIGKLISFIVVRV